MDWLIALVTPHLAESKDEENYQICMTDPTKFRSHLDHTYSRHPELFPEAFKGGYSLHGFVYSKKQEIKTRRFNSVYPPGLTKGAEWP
jgi:hypothetical protein